MAELTINTNDIVSALRKHLEGFDPAVETKTVGRVLEVGDGIAYVSGLPKAGVNELLEFEDGTLGLALNLDEETPKVSRRARRSRRPAASFRCRSATAFSAAW